MKKKLIRLTSMGLAAVMTFGLAACTGNGGGSNGGGSASLEYTKPDSIKMTFDTCMTPENGVNDVCAKYEELTGIKLELEKPDHAKYYEKITLSFASGNPSDVIEMGSTYYPENANNGALWDMTDAWENTTAHCKEIIDESYVDALKMDVRDGSGMRLYGFPTVAGNGTITYVREDWLKDAGMDLPTDYDGFIKMLRAFKERGSNGKTPGAIPLTAAGLLNNGETPYDIYLREFYQDAIPDFYQKEDGTWVDGFSEPAMAGAMQRFQDAYKEGLLDETIITNETKSCRDKFNDGLVGAFNYWAGSWGMKLEDGTPGAKLSALPAIDEVRNSGGYIGRVPLAMVITSDCEMPEAVFNDLILYSHDGGEGQMLFTHGVEGVHYTKNDDGSITALEQKADPSKLVEKSFYAPEYSITSWTDPMTLDSRVQASLDVYLQCRSLAKVAPASSVLTENQDKLTEIRKSVLADVLHGNTTVDEAMQKYNKDSSAIVEAILADLSSSQN